jgi:hypothetical protein
MTQYANPTSDISKTDWTQYAGNSDTNAFDELDEGMASTDGDTTAWQTDSTAGVTRTIECGLNSVTDPNVATGHVIRCSAKKSASGGAAVTGVLYLYEGTTLRATSGTLTTTSSYQTLSYTLSEAEANAITSYSTLRLRFIATIGAGTARRARISTMEFSCPNVTYAQAASGGVTPAGATAQRTGKVASGELTSAGALISSVRKIVSGALAAAGELLTQKLGSGTTYYQVVDGALGLAGTVVNSTRKALSGAVTSAGILVQRTGKIMAGGITPAGAVATVKTALISLAGTLTMSGEPVRRASKTLAGAIAPDGGLIKRTAASLAGTVTSSGVVATVKAALLALGGALGLGGEIVRQTGKSLGGQIVPEGGLVRKIGKLLAGAFQAAGALIAALSSGDRLDDVSVADAALFEISLGDAGLFGVTLSDTSNP